MKVRETFLTPWVCCKTEWDLNVKKSVIWCAFNGNVLYFHSKTDWMCQKSPCRQLYWWNLSSLYQSQHQCLWKHWSLGIKEPASILYHFNGTFWGVPFSSFPLGTVQEWFMAISFSTTINKLQGKWACEQAAKGLLLLSLCAESSTEHSG